MDKQQMDFLTKWANECKRHEDSRIQCAVTIWNYDTVEEKLEVGVGNYKIIVPGFEKSSWLDFFAELESQKNIVFSYKGTDGCSPIRRVDFNYRFASQIVIDEYSA